MFRLKWRTIALVAAGLWFAATYVYLGNPIINEIGDYGSAGIQQTDPCNSPNIFC